MGHLIWHQLWMSSANKRVIHISEICLHANLCMGALPQWKGKNAIQKKDDMTTISRKTNP